VAVAFAATAETARLAVAALTQAAILHVDLTISTIRTQALSHHVLLVYSMWCDSGVDTGARIHSQILICALFSFAHKVGLEASWNRAGA
jgi:hypothetical protein